MSVRTPSITNVILASMSLVLALVCASGRVGAQEKTRRLTGIVVDSAGAAIPYAQIAVDRTNSVTRADEAGRFALEGVSTRRVQLRVRRIGFLPAMFAVGEAGADTVRELRIRLTPIVPLLDGVTVEVLEEAYRARLAGFEKRSASKVGHFITRERIERLNGGSLPELLREVPGVRVGRLEGLDHAVRIRGAKCPPAVWIDGFPARASEFDLDMIDPEIVEGIEVYSSASTVPNEFAGTGAELQCGVIVIWSRPARARGRLAPRDSTGAAHRDTIRYFIDR